MTIYRKDARFTDVDEQDQTYIIECNAKRCSRKLEHESIPPGTAQDEEFAMTYTSPFGWGMDFEVKGDPSRPDRPARHYCPEHRIKPRLKGGEIAPDFLLDRVALVDDGYVPTARLWEEFQRYLETLPEPPDFVPGKHALFEAVREYGGRNSTKSVRLNGRSTTMPVFRGIALEVTTPGDHLEWYERFKGEKIGAAQMKRSLAAKALDAQRRRADQALSAKLRYHGLEPKVALACAAQGCTELALESAAGDLGWVRAVVGEHELYACLAHTSVFDGIREATAPPVATTDDDDEIILDEDRPEGWSPDDFVRPTDDQDFESIAAEFEAMPETGVIDNEEYLYPGDPGYED